MLLLRAPTILTALLALSTFGSLTTLAQQHQEAQWPTDPEQKQQPAEGSQRDSHHHYHHHGHGDVHNPKHHHHHGHEHEPAHLQPPQQQQHEGDAAAHQPPLPVLQPHDKDGKHHDEDAAPHQTPLPFLQPHDKDGKHGNHHDGDLPKIPAQHDKDGSDEQHHRDQHEHHQGTMPNSPQQQQPLQPAHHDEDGKSHDGGNEHNRHQEGAAVVPPAMAKVPQQLMKEPTNKEPNSGSRSGSGDHKKDGGMPQPNKPQQQQGQGGKKGAGANPMPQPNNPQQQQGGKKGSGAAPMPKKGGKKGAGAGAAAPMAKNLGADAEKLQAVKEAFLYNWDNYEKYAFGNDTLAPVSKKGQNLNGILGAWGATVYDSISTMIVMGLPDSDARLRRALDFVSKIDFNTTKGGDPPGVVSLFELTIRGLGGILSARDLLEARKSPVPDFLAKQAKNLAETFMPGWVHQIPFNYVNITAKKPADLKATANYAEAGTIQLEWSRLSDVTGDEKYRKLVLGSLDALIHAKDELPGLPGQQIWPQNNTHPDSLPGRYVTWSGGTDSYFEYLPKLTMLTGNEAPPLYLDTFHKAVQSSKQHLLIKTGVGNLTFLSDYSKDLGGNVFRSSGLACFSGASWAYGGKMLGDDDFIQKGLELAESCGRTYLNTATGIGPSHFGYRDGKNRLEGYKKTVSEGKESFYKEHGYFPMDNQGGHAPETIESIMYAWRITGAQFWRDMAWSMFQSLRQYLDTKSGWAEIADVNDRAADWIDDQGSYLYAEVFKYYYMIFDDPAKLSLDEWVLNTECHPLKIKKDRSKWPNIQFNSKGSKPFPYVPLGDVNVERAPTAPPTSTFKAQQKSVVDNGVQEGIQMMEQEYGMPEAVARAQYSPLPGAQMGWSAGG